MIVSSSFQPKPPAGIAPFVKGLRVSKHPSIWKRDYRFVVSLNGMAPSKPKTPVKKQPTPKKRIVETIEDSDDENLPTESQNDELVLNQYINAPNGPSPKRFKEYIEDDDDNESVEKEANCVEEPLKEDTTPTRNPFKKAVASKNEAVSLTTISKENNSLIKTQSPVKNIDYVRLEKISKFSRFNRTVLPNNGQQVLSRFFNASEKTKCDAQPAQKPPSEVTMKSPNLLDSDLGLPSSSLYFTKSSDSGFSPNANDSSPEASKGTSEESAQNGAIDDDLGSEMSRESQRSIIDKFKFVLAEKLEKCEPEHIESSSSQIISEKTDSDANELPIGFDDDDSGTSSQKTANDSKIGTWLNGIQKTKMVSV